jgi:chromosomal replication initiator protein
MLAKQLWERACERLREVFNAEIFRLWIGRLRVLEYQSNTLTLGVWDEFSQIWLQTNYVGVIEESLCTLTGESITVQLSVVPFPEEKGNSETATVAEEPPAEEDVKGENPASNSSALPPVPPTVYNPKASSENQPSLNSKYTFDTFVVGTNSNLAHASAQAVAHEPGRSYNPLFIYGGVGLGKTHLLHAIGNYVLKHKQGMKVVYVSLEKFMNEYIEAIRDKRCDRFRKRYRNVDVLLIDDIQFLTDKEGLQEEFYHTFNSLHDIKKQIVMTSDRPVGEIKALEARLVSRFSWGLVADLQPPNVEVRMAILKQKAAAMGVEVPGEIVSFLAQKIRANVRELEGALIRLSSYINLTKASWSIETAQLVLQELLSRQNIQAPTIDAIQREVARFFDIRTTDITGKRRPGNIAFPRQVAMYLSRQLTDHSLTAIGQAFGGRDHGTVIHACKVVQDRMEVEEGVRQNVLQLESIFNS